VRSAKAAAGQVTYASAADAMSLAVSGVGGTLSVNLSAAIQGLSTDVPDSGALRVVADDRTSLALTVSDGGAVTLGVDADGDGKVDGTIPTNWAELR